MVFFLCFSSFLFSGGGGLWQYDLPSFLVLNSLLMTPREGRALGRVSRRRGWCRGASWRAAAINARPVGIWRRRHNGYSRAGRRILLLLGGLPRGGGGGGWNSSSRLDTSRGLIRTFGGVFPPLLLQLLLSLLMLLFLLLLLLLLLLLRLLLARRQVGVCRRLFARAGGSGRRCCR